jgi:cysteine-rich repeat protein
LDLQSNKCKEICPDGIVYEDQCDDNNTANNDGCSSECKLELGSFLCDTRQAPTKCVSTLDLVYEVETIAKS